MSQIRAVYKCFIVDHDSPFSTSYNLLYQAVFPQILLVAASNLNSNENDSSSTQTLPVSIGHRHVL